MARRRIRAPLKVCLNGRLVGWLRKESSGAIDFRYDESWLGWENAIPVSVSLPLREDRYIGEPVVAVFDNLLPDNTAIRKRLAERAQADGSDAYSLLAAVGRDCVGALQFLPESEEPGPAGAIMARAVTDENIADIIDGLARNPLGVGEDKEFRISIAGVQEKTALLRWKSHWHVPHGTTATTHILKPQIGMAGGMDLSHSVENEYLCLKLAAALGLPTADSAITDFAGTRVLVIERFDRTWTTDGRLLRIPQEDCCQALSVPLSRKYESEGGPGICSLLEFLKGSDEPEKDQVMLFKAQIVFWLLAATDGHAKNFSIRLAPGGRFRLTPLYDILSAQPNADAGQIPKNRMKLAMAVGENRHYRVDTLNGRHFLQTADRCGLQRKRAEAIIEELAETGSSQIEAALADLPKGFPADIAEAISKGAQNRLTSLAQRDSAGSSN